MENYKLRLKKVSKQAIQNIQAQRMAKTRIVINDMFLKLHNEGFSKEEILDILREEGYTQGDK